VAADSNGMSAAHPVNTDKAFSVEQHGVDLIPDAERHGKPLDLFWVWLGANVIFTYIIDGAIILGFGLSFWPAVAAIVIGNLFLLLVGIGAISGPRTGTATLLISRSAFGVLGNIPAALLSWITVVGWEAVNLVIATFALYQLAIEIHLPSGNATKAICLVLIMVVTFVVAAWGHQTIVVMQKWFSVALGVGTLVLAGFVFPKMHLHFAAAPLAAKTPFSSWLLALLIIAAGAFSWVNYPADYSRYLRRQTKARPVIVWTTLGCFIPAVFITLVGLAAGTATNMTDQVAGIQKLVPTWFGTLYLAIIVGGGITNNFLNTYSSGLSLLSIGIKIPRVRSIIFDAVIGGGMAVYAVFIYNFTNSFIEFLSLMVIWIAPWCGIYLTDMFMRRVRYNAPALFERDGTYWYSRGWNWRAIGAFALGIGAALLFANAPLYQGPLIGVIGNGDISIYVGFVVSAVSYYLLMRGVIASQSGALTASADEAIQQPQPAASPAGALEAEETAP
jgi:nucleobase:cation symporter-1, NCS1 family